MFEIYSYLSEQKLYGIRILKTNIQLGDVNLINSFKFIKYTADPGLEIEYYHLCFDNFFDLNLLNNICELLNQRHLLYPQSSLSELLAELKSLFSTKREENVIKEYLGLMCELFFIYHFQTQQINLLKYYQLENDQYDFNFSCAQLEIKYLNKEKNSFKISAHQLINIANKRTEIVGVHYVNNSVNGQNLYQLFNLINFTNQAEKHSIIKEKVQHLYTCNQSIFNTYKIDLINSNLFALNHEFNNIIPLIQSLQSNQNVINLELELKLAADATKLKSIILELVQNENL